MALDKDSGSTTPEILDVREYHAGNKICFQLKVSEDIAAMSDEQLEKYLKLSLTISLNNLVLFNSQGTLKRYTGALEIIDDFFKQRLPFYEKRRSYLISKSKNELELA
jgi:DNA topoisomerase-2